MSVNAVETDVAEAFVEDPVAADETVAELKPRRLPRDLKAL